MVGITVLAVLSTRKNLYENRQNKLNKSFIIIIRNVTFFLIKYYQNCNG